MAWVYLRNGAGIPPSSDVGMKATMGIRLLSWICWGTCCSLYGKVITAIVILFTKNVLRDIGLSRHYYDPRIGYHASTHPVLFRIEAYAHSLGD